MNKSKLLIVDDDAEICTQMTWAFRDQYAVFVAPDRQRALEIFQTERPPVVTLDLGLPPRPREVEEGFRTLYDLLEVDARVKVIVITGRDGREHALQAVSQGAADFFHKPIQLDELKVVIRRAFHVSQLEQENRALPQHTDEAAFEGMLGVSAQMRTIFTMIRKVARTDASVLLTGESGTGKEMVAQAIHRHSDRRHKPFVAINCGAIPEHLLESELFGHEKGAFTGAHMQRKGRLEMVQGGTLLLDEIGDLSLPLQVKLLRVLQEQRIERVGGREMIPVNARVIAATHVDLQHAMEEGRFREDLYYRLGVVVLALPPLRERGEDILLIASTMLQRYAADSKQKICGFSREATLALQKHDWPGNVRELENRIQRAVIMTQGPRVTASDLDLVSQAQPYDGISLKEARQAIEKDLIMQALSKNNGHVTRTAAELGVSRSTMHELLSRYGIAR